MRLLFVTLPLLFSAALALGAPIDKRTCQNSNTAAQICAEGCEKFSTSKSRFASPHPGLVVSKILNGDSKAEATATQSK